MRDYSQYFSILKGYALKLTRNKTDAEDLFQTTIMKLLEYDHTFDGKNPIAWAATIMRNHLYSMARSSEHKKRAAMPPDYDLTPAAEYPMEFRETMRALYALPPRQRDVLIARAQGYDIKETAKLLGIEENTVKSRTSRAREALRIALNPHPRRSLSS